MEFKKIIESIPLELVENWWRNEAPATAPAQNEGIYYLEKEGKELPFKFVVVEVARKAGHDLSVGDFASESSKRALFADRFGFRIEEKLGYNNTELADLQRLHTGLRDPESFKKFLSHANQLVKAIGIAPYVIRMALPERACLLELGARAILKYRELPSGIEVKFMLLDEDVKQLDMALSPEVERFRPVGVSWVTLHFPSWSEIPSALLEQNERAVRLEYDRVKDSRLSEIRLGSKTTNAALKYAVYQNADIPNMRPMNKAADTQTDMDIFKLGCNWGKGQPDFYDMIRDRSLIITVPDYLCSIGDLIVVTSGYRVRAIAKVRSEPVPVTSMPNLAQPFVAYNIEYRDSVLVAEADWYPLPTDKEFEYRLQQGIVAVQDPNIRKKVVDLWCGRDKAKMPTLTALNTILYGPPGTGKTHTLKNSYFERFTTMPSEVPREQRIFDALQDLTWWEVIGVVLLANGPSNVDGIMHHELVQAKAAMSRSQNVRATIWSNLQFHTVNECSLVKYEKRSEPLIFNKKENSVWEVLGQAVDESYPELRDQLDRYRSDYQEKGEENKEIKRYEFVTFHQAYTYEDFIEGLKPQLDSKEIGYEIVPGIFKRLCERAEQDPDHDYALFIDEINRGNIAAIFGELITLIEEDKRLGATNELRATLPYSKPATFGVPANVRIVGTMNTADRSVEALDTALRRRFSFVECPSKPMELERLDYRMVGEVDLSKLLTVINARLEMLLDRDHHIGHSYFMNWGDGDKEQKLRQVFKNNIVPLLQEYFYGDPVKVGLVLGDKFVRNADEDKTAKVEFASAFRKAVDIEPKTRYVFQDVMDRMLVPMQAFKDICDGK